VIRILVVDNDPLFRAPVSVVLRRAGCAVATTL
jgi:hypothetical protein